MFRSIISTCGLLVAAFWSAPLAVPAQETQDDRAGIAFKAAESTRLSEILTKRRLTLEKRQGGPLTGHQWWLWGLGSFDYDRDGDTDLLVCVHGSTNGVLLRNQLKETGTLKFADVTEELGVDGFIPSTDNYPLVWDFDGDGYLDIAGLLDDSETPCLLNRGGERFVKASFSLHPINYPDEIRDLNGDGYIDIAQVRRGKRIQFLYDAKGASFRRTEAPAETPPELPASLRDEMKEVRAKDGNRFVKFKTFRRDLNGDGRLDLVLRAFGSYSGDRLGWYLIANENGEYTDRTQALGLPRSGAPLLIEDFDHDGDTDVLIASGAEAGLFLNDGTGGFSVQSGPLTDFVKQRCPYLHVAKRADFDHDGDLDLAVSNRRYGREMVFENLGDGRFISVLSVRGWDADPLVLRDINDDGLVDVIVGGAGEKENIGVYLNVTPKTGNACRLYVRLESPNVYGVGTRLELFHAGALDKKHAQPNLEKAAPLDGSPVHLGLGDAASFDVRVTFPGQKTLEIKNVAARPRLYVTAEGISPTQPK